jgi:EVE domain
VRRGVALGIAQIGHGARAPLLRMAPGDGLVYYSPRQTLGSDHPLRAFTAIGRVMDGEVWQADEGEFHPWRRRVDYAADAAEVAVADLDGRLELTARPSWGYALRRGLVPLGAADFAVIARAMGAAGV